MTQFLLNNTIINSPIAEGIVLLDFLRQHQQLTGTRSACREGDCGSCMVLYGELNQGNITYHPATSCLLPLGLLAGRHIVTIEGINLEHLNPIQQALVDQGAIQCGFCTPGLVIAITAYFLTPSNHSLTIDAVSGNLCRCTGYAGIKRALNTLSRNLPQTNQPPTIA